MPTLDAMLADTVVIAHAGYVAFVMFGLIAILIGAALGWRWTRALAFRIAHLAAIVLVCVESFVGVMCPLTSLEDWLRRSSGGAEYRGEFLGYWAHRLIFYDFSPQVFTAIYVAFAGLVLITFLLVPPRWPAIRRPSSVIAR